ncbi:MAG: hypothetical protein LBI87_12695 [Candidatus Accumulibacter sp.]|jgi:hypothetical protein|nr:hypothetical protein [Accumulibacter sp.]
MSEKSTSVFPMPAKAVARPGTLEWIDESPLRMARFTKPVPAGIVDGVG